MPSNILIFDADYVSELTARMNTACELLAGAVSSLKSAGNHENWKCKERARIIESFDELNYKLNRLDSGVNETTRILGASVSRFASLEKQYEAQADNLSEEITSSHGFTASVRSGSSAPGGGHAAGKNISGATTAAAAGTLGASEVPSAKQPDGKNNAGSVSKNSAGTFRVNMGNNIFSPKKEEGGNGSSSSQNPETGGGFMSVNLPVTYIPDNPGAAAKGTKDTREIADAALNSVVKVMRGALGGGRLYENGSSASSLAETYYAGKTVFESSSSILASPSMPHTSERLAMAAGLVTIMHETEFHQQQSFSSSENFSVNASRISSDLQDNTENSEFRQLLESFAGNNSSILNSEAPQSQTDEKLSFFEMILQELKKAFSGIQDNVSSSEASLDSSSPIRKFLDTLVMEQAG